MPNLSNVNSDIYTQLGLGGNASAKANKNGQLGQADFLALMTKQLANQDPFKPMDNGQFIAQMAQFSSVDSLQRLERSFSDLSVAMSSNQALQASTLVGDNVLVPADVGYLQDTGGVSGVAGIPGPIQNAKLTITDQNGQVIRSINLGAQTGPEVPFNWDGKDEKGVRVASGIYHLAFTGDQGGATTQFQTLVSTQVESISLGGVKGVVLNLVGLGPVDLKDVSRIGG